jgi:hypothetical protein
VKFFLLLDFALEALSFAVPQWVFVAFLMEMAKTHVSILGHCGALGGTDVVRGGRFGFKGLIIFTQTSM